MISICDHKQYVKTSLDAVMKRYEITKGLLKNSEIKHEFMVTYRRDRNSICLGGDFWCPELWDVIGKSVRRNDRLSQYIPGNLIKIDSWILDFDTGIGLESVDAYFEELVRDAVKPIVLNMQTPSTSAAFFKKHPPLLLFGPALADKYLRMWSEHYNLLD